MSSSKKLNVNTNSKCIICNGQLKNTITLKIVYCCNKEVHQDCWVAMMKQNHKECYHCCKLYSYQIQTNIKQNIEKKEKFERNQMNDIFKYLEKE